MTSASTPAPVVSDAHDKLGFTCCTCNARIVLENDYEARLAEMQAEHQAEVESQLRRHVADLEAAVGDVQARLVAARSRLSILVQKEAAR